MVPITNPTQCYQKVSGKIWFQTWLKHVKAGWSSTWNHQSTAVSLFSCGRCQPCAQEPAPQSTTRALKRNFNSLNVPYWHEVVADSSTLYCHNYKIAMCEWKENTSCIRDHSWLQIETKNPFLRPLEVHSALLHMWFHAAHNKLETSRKPCPCPNLHQWLLLWTQVSRAQTRFDALFLTAAHRKPCS